MWPGGCMTGLSRGARVVQWLAHLLGMQETWVRLPVRGVLFSPFASVGAGQRAPTA